MKPKEFVLKTDGTKPQIDPRGLRQSAINDWEQCPYKYYLKHIEQRPERPGRAATIGTIVHKGLEAAFQWWKERDIEECADGEAQYDSHERRFVSIALDAARRCYSLEKQRGAPVELSDLKDALQLLSAYPENYPLPSGDVHVSMVEKEFSFDYKKVKFTGTMDLVVHDENDGIWKVVDYKTSRTPDKTKHEVQSVLYRYGAYFLEFDSLDVSETEFYLQWLRHGSSDDISLTNEDCFIILDSLVFIAKEIESAREFPTRFSQLCAWCGYKDQCPTYQGLIVDAIMTPAREYAIEEIDIASPKEVALRYNAVANLKRALQEEQEQLSAVLKGHLEEAGTIEVEGVSYGLSTVTMQKYQVYDVVRVIQEETGNHIPTILQDIAKIETTKLEKYLEGGSAELIGRVQAHTSKVAGAPRLNVTRIPKNRGRSEPDPDAF